MTQYAEDSAQLAMNKQLAVARVSKESSEKKVMWKEYEQRMMKAIKIEFDVQKEELEKNVNAGIMQVDAHKDNKMKGIETAEAMKQKDLLHRKELDTQEIQERMAEARTMVTMEGYHARKPKRESDGSYLEMRKKAKTLDMNKKREADEVREKETKKAVDESKRKEINPRCVDAMEKMERISRD